MKKNKILFILIVFITVMFVGSIYVNAASLFNKDWAVVNRNINSSIELVSTDKGTLLTGFANNARTGLYLYDTDGKVIASKKIDSNIMYVAGFEKDNAFYLIGIVNNTVMLDKYSEKLEKISSEDTGYSTNSYSFCINIKDNIFYLLNNDGDYRQEGREVGSVLVINMNNINDIKTIDEESFVVLFPNLKYDYNKYSYLFFIDNVLSIRDDSDYLLVYGGNDYKALNGDVYVDATRMGNYILGLASNEMCMRKSNNEQKSCSFVDVFDSSMNLIERIDISEGDKTQSYIGNNIVATSNNSFVVVSEVGDIFSNNFNVLVSKYSLPYNVETKTDGHGNIKVSVTKAATGTVVTFTVTPEEGYVLDVVKVTDANGNIVYFKDYTFTMPSADVLVEASFVKKEESKEINPETSVRGTITFALFITVGGILLLTKYIIDVKRYE